MTWCGSAVNQRLPLRRAILVGVASLLTGCASMESAPSDRLDGLRTKAQACSEALPTISQYDVDRFGRVRASAQGPEASVIERNFFDCVDARGRWTTWTPGQPAPMLEPLGTENPDPNPGLRVP
jgi:hypothetical protein